jgi:glycyl-tRNA synthetase
LLSLFFPLPFPLRRTAEVKTKFESCKFKCSCGSTEFSDPHQFNLLMQTQAGTLRTYLRPETAQGIFVSFDRVRTSASLFLPFGIGQIGKAFRNEISPRDLLFRMREFEQLEVRTYAHIFLFPISLLSAARTLKLLLSLTIPSRYYHLPSPQLEYFCMPDDSPRHYAEFVSDCHGFLLDHGLHPDNIRLNAYTEGLAHYALATTDIEYKFPFGWGELWGIANRGDFDLRQHGVGKTAIIDELRRSAPPQTKPVPPPPGRDLPHTVEPSVGLDRLFMAVLSDGWRTETVRRVRNDVVTAHTRTVLGIHHELAPYRVAVIPSRTDPEVRGAALALHKRLAKLVPASLDVTGTIGKRYMRQDEIGTPYILTVDPETYVILHCRPELDWMLCDSHCIS